MASYLRSPSFSPIKFVIPPGLGVQCHSVVGGHTVLPLQRLPIWPPNQSRSGIWGSKHDNDFQWWSRCLLTCPDFSVDLPRLRYRLREEDDAGTILDGCRCVCLCCVPSHCGLYSTQSKVYKCPLYTWIIPSIWFLIVFICSFVSFSPWVWPVCLPFFFVATWPSPGL